MSGQIDFYVSSDGFVFRPLRGGKGGGSGGGGTTTTVQNNDPWAGQQDFLKFGFQQAQDQFNSNKPEYFQGNTIAGFNPIQQAAQGATINRAMSGSPVLQAGQGEAAKTLSGDYLKAGNPYIGGLTDSINAQVRPMVDSRFSGAGRYGSTAHAGATSDAMTRALAPLMFNSYEAERGRMGATMAQAPSLAQADYGDISALGSVGKELQGLSQDQINAAIEKHNFEQNTEANKLAQYMQQIGGNYGGQSTQVQSQKGGGNPFADIASLGGGLGTAAIGTALLMGKSDIRLKTDIKRVGQTDSGIPIYTFRYKSGGPIVMGVMAQDVEKVMPEAVGEIDGFKAVDYGRIV